MTENRSQSSSNQGMGTRHKSRELALHTLYACEVGNTDQWHSMLDQIADSEQMSTEMRKYARELVKKVLEETDTIDDILTSKAQNWELKRMATIDRNVLRIAVAELQFFPEVPFKVVIDEAVEIAKTFGTEDSGKFVNGILDSVHKQL